MSRALEAQPWDLLRTVLDELGIEDPGASYVHLRRFCELLMQWNRKVANLISRNDESRILTRHVLESIRPAHHLRLAGAQHWMDVGSGGGLPAIPLALVGIGPSWTLVESRRSKALFLRRAAEQLELPGVKVVQNRAEDLVGNPEHEGAYDALTSRATLPLGPTLSLAAHFVRPRGVAFLWKGSRREDELTKEQDWALQWDLEGEHELPDTQTVVVRFKRKT